MRGGMMMVVRRCAKYLISDHFQKVSKYLGSLQYANRKVRQLGETEGPYTALENRLVE
jgi:hypothetical protein